MDTFSIFRSGGYFLATRPRQQHPLHHVIPYHGSFKPEVANYAVQQYSRPGEVVLDPFCGRGTTALAALLAGRVPYSFDTSPLAVHITSAKCRPYGPTAVRRWLARLSHGGQSEQDSRLEPFFHPKTLRTLAALRSALAKDHSDLGRWVALLALARLHGHSSGYLSAPTFDTVAISPAAQARRLKRLGATVEPRALAPRVLDACRRALARPLPPWFGLAARRARTQQADAASLPLASGSVDLVVTSPPYLDQIDYLSEQWLRLWLLDIDPEAYRTHQAHWSQPDRWVRWFDTVLRELARVLKTDGFCVVDVAAVRRGRSIVALPELCLETAWLLGWRAWALYEHRAGGGRCFKARASPDRERVSTLLVLQRIQGTVAAW